jgi:hypothetical protein
MVCVYHNMRQHIILPYHKQVIDQVLFDLYHKSQPKWKDKKMNVISLRILTVGVSFLSSDFKISVTHSRVSSRSFFTTPGCV